MPITAILAEDEPILRAQLKAKLARLWPELQILADVGDGEAALEAITELQPQLAFLDIQMPEMTGVEVARSLASNPDLRCHVVFVTAFDQYALEAYENGVADYLLKPYSDERLSATITRLQARLSAVPAEAPQNLDALLSQLTARLNPQASRLKWIKASAGNQIRLIPIDEVLFFQAGDKYTVVATREADALIRTPLKELLAGLDPDQFWQIHRSTIVQAASIERVSRDLRGQITLKVRERRETLVVSRPFAHLFKHM